MDGKRISSEELLKKGIIINPIEIRFIVHRGREIFLMCKNIEAETITIKTRFTLSDIYEIIEE